jgi:hypothetical protein
LEAGLAIFGDGLEGLAWLPQPLTGILMFCCLSGGCSAFGSDEREDREKHIDAAVGHFLVVNDKRFLCWDICLATTQFFGLMFL